MRKIFTMIELLIVISIIAVLAAMLLPALGKARDRAMAIKCVSNLKNIHLMAVSYLNDNPKPGHNCWIRKASLIRRHSLPAFGAVRNRRQLTLQEIIIFPENLEGWRVLSRPESV